MLACDARDDLTDSDRILEWLGQEQLVLPLTDLDGRRTPRRDFWGTIHAERFAACVFALRSIANRIKSYKVRTPLGDPWQSDLIFRSYLGLLRLSPRRNPTKKGLMPEPLNKKNFAGLMINVTRPDRNSFGGITAEHKLTEFQIQGFLDLEKFWGNIFGSFIWPEIAPVCGACGNALDPTPTGRRSRAKFCKSCAFKGWEKKQSVKNKRRRWREAKAQWRADEKPKVKTTA
jgi:hypothetical protein